MNPDKRFALLHLMLIDGMLGQLSSRTEVTRKLSKLMRQIRLGKEAARKLIGSTEYNVMGTEVNKSWDTMKVAIGKENKRNVAYSMIIERVYDAIASTSYQHLWFTDKTFSEGMGSLSHGFTPTKQDHEDTYFCADALLEGFGKIKESVFAKKIRLAKKIKEQNDILEGK